ncbi:MAG: SDR family oxidoreductase [Rhodospirillales bacterium]|nr:SDR family oxidoreductase [Rhodospirillales bacterium]
MRVLLTGADGYIGVRMGHYLLARNHEVVGLDSGFHRSGWLYNSDDRRPAMITKDTRQVTEEDLAGFDAVVHLAEVSNDPVGEVDPGVTYKINHQGTVYLANQAKRAGVRRFVHMSSCSVYGASSDRASKEGDATAPLTSYAKCKLLVEQDVGALASDDFSPTFLRNATAYGASPRQRFDLVVNDLAASAYIFREIRMTSDGKPWRPFVHILDISHAVACVLEAPQDAIHGEIFNVGSEEQNYQVRQIAEILSELVPGCSLVFGDSADARNYRVDFSKIHERLPGFRCAWNVARGAREMLDMFARVGFAEDLYRWSGHTRLKQIRYLLDSGQIDENFFWCW